MGRVEQVFARNRWYLDYIANRKSETGPWNYLNLRTCLTDRETSEALHRAIGADVPMEITPPDITARSFDDEETHADTHMTKLLVEVE